MTGEDKRRKIMKCMDKWLFNLEDGKRISDYLSIFHLYRIGIYGYGVLGKHLAKELRGKDFHIAWVMDRRASGDCIYGNVVRPDSLGELEDVDIAIIATVSDIEEVESQLLQYVTGKIITVEELIDSVYTWGNQD